MLKIMPDIAPSRQIVGDSQPIRGWRVDEQLMMQEQTYLNIAQAVKNEMGIEVGTIRPR